MSSRYSRTRRSRNYYVPRKEKYQFVPFSINGQMTTSRGLTQIICPPSTVSGNRKIKNIGFDITTNSPIPLLYAVFYVPEGGQQTQITPQINEMTSQNLGNPQAFVELFAANQWVIGCGSVTSGAIARFRSRMARNLNNGDFVALLVFTADQSIPSDANPAYSIEMNVTGNYAIKYN